jgi:hypothetical protein
VPLEVFEEVLDHGDQDHDGEGDEDSRFSFCDRDDGDSLEDANQQEIDCMVECLRLASLVNCSMRLMGRKEMKLYLDVSILLVRI